MQTFHIHIKGRVQGVGFRPFVYKLAKSEKLKGWVCNSADGVHIEITTIKGKAIKFYNACLKSKPHLAVITDATIHEVSPEYFSDFTIRESSNGNLELNISPDFGMCATCLNELNDKNNRRYMYPFITCTDCGPRYSIISQLPYDRAYTSMDSFTMCQDCQNEYDDPWDRRYFSQTNSCDTCGIRLTLSNANGLITKAQDTARILSLAAKKLKNGSIIAIKGIGGYLLLCDAKNENVIARLRSLKHRPSKPFAVLYPGGKAIEQSFIINDCEKQALESAIAPIVLLTPKAHNLLPIHGIAPGLNKVGVMVPYAPVLAIIAKQFGDPLIATSANLSGAPIVHEEDESRLFMLCDYVLSNNRPILFPQDDSVIQYSTQHKKEIILRRSRGMAPSIFSPLPDVGSDVLALGAEVKGSFALSVSKNTYISQYLGNLSHYENQVQFEAILHRFIDLVAANVQHIVIDKHPGYFTHQLGKSTASEKGIRWVEVQHHEAHFAAILAEKRLTNHNHVLGVVWDGTGLGNDGHSWGGEFFDYTDFQISRLAHLSYFGQLSNDRMAIDNRLCALSFMGEELGHQFQPAFNSAEWEFYSKSIQKPIAKTSSMGRVFDAFAFLSGVSAKNNYEGQSAMLLEQQARNYLQRNTSVKPYLFELNGTEVTMKPALEEILYESKNGYQGIGTRFHMTMVEIIRAVATRDAYHKIAFSGGVFQNSLLVDLLIDQLGEEFQLHFHQELSPNDENIAYGQLAHLHYIHNKENSNLKSVEACV